jgi:hypothetical protein
MLVARLGEAGPWGIGGVVVALVVGLYGLALMLRIDTAEHAPPAPGFALEVAGLGVLAAREWMSRELARAARPPSAPR